MPGTSKSGGKRAGAGRKAGAAWKSARVPAIRSAARAAVLEILEGGRDPLLSLLAIADDPETPVDQRIKAYSALMPYVRPRLSMVVTADATPEKGAAEVDQTQLLALMLRKLDVLASRNQTTTVTIEAKRSEIED